MNTRIIDLTQENFTIKHFEDLYLYPPVPKPSPYYSRQMDGKFKICAEKLRKERCTAAIDVQKLYTNRVKNAAICKATLCLKVKAKSGADIACLFSYGDIFERTLFRAEAGETVEIDLTRFLSQAYLGQVFEFAIKPEAFSEITSSVEFENPELTVEYADIKTNFEYELIPPDVRHPALGFEIPDCGRGSFDLYNTSVKFAHVIKNAEQTALPVDVVCVYDENLKKDIGYGQNIRLNLSQSLFHPGRRQQTESQEDYDKRYQHAVTPVDYTDDAGNKSVFRERFYYMDQGVRRYVGREKLQTKYGSELYVDANANFRINIGGKSREAYREMCDDFGTELHINFSRQDALSTLRDRKECYFVIDGTVVDIELAADGSYRFDAYYCNILTRDSGWYEFRMRYQYVTEENGVYTYDNGKDRFVATKKSTRITSFLNDNKTAFSMQFETGYWCSCGLDYPYRTFNILSRQSDQLDAVTEDAARLRTEADYYTDALQETEDKIQHYIGIRDAGPTRREKLLKEINDKELEACESRVKLLEIGYVKGKNSIDEQLEAYNVAYRNQMQQIDIELAEANASKLTLASLISGERNWREQQISLLNDSKKQLEDKKEENYNKRLEQSKKDLDALEIEKTVNSLDLEQRKLNSMLAAADEADQIEEINKYIKDLETQKTEIQNQLNGKLSEYYSLIEKERQMPIDYIVKGGIYYWFDYYGKLCTVMSDEERYYSLDRTDAGMPKSFTDQDGVAVLEFVYSIFENPDNKQKSERLSQIIDSKNRTVQFTYDGIYLKSIRHPSRDLALAEKDLTHSLATVLNSYPTKLQFADEKADRAIRTESVYLEYTNGLLCEITNAWGNARELVKSGATVTLIEKTYATDIDDGYIFDYSLKTAPTVKESVKISYGSNKITVSRGEEIVTYVFGRDETLSYTARGNFDPSIERASDHMDFSYPGAESSHSVSVVKESANYIENGNFQNGLNGWRVTPDRVKTVIAGTRTSLMMNGSMREAVRAVYSVDASKITDPYGLVLTAYAKASSVHVNFNRSYQAQSAALIEEVLSSRFTLHTEVFYAGYELPECYAASYDCYKTAKQLLCLAVPIDAARSLSKVDVILDYSYNTGNAEFSNVKLYNADFDYAEKVARNTTAASMESGKNSRTEILSHLLNQPTKTRTTDADGIFTYASYAYNFKGNLLSSEDADGVVTEYVYDEKGRVKTESSFHKDEPALKYVKDLRYDDYGRETESVGELYGNETKNKTVYHPNSDDVRSVSSPSGVRTTYGYDYVTGRLLNVTSDADGEENNTSYSYNYGFVGAYADSNGSRVKYTYDRFGRMNSVSLNGNKQWTKTYEDRITVGDKLADRVTTAYNTNEFDEFVVMRENKTGNILTIVHRTREYGNIIQSFAYDESGDKLLKKSNYETGTTEEYEYGENNAKAYVTKAVKKDATGELARTETTYDRKERVTGAAVTLKNKNLTYGYEYDREQLVQTTLPEGQTMRPETDKLSRTTGYALYDGETELYATHVSYVKSGDIASQSVSAERNFIKGVSERSLKYLYDDGGNITQISENNRLVKRYAYDKLNRLIREDDAQLDLTKRFFYDANGNITETETGAFTLDELLSASVRQSYRYGKEHPDRLMGIDSALDFSYDALGNPVSYKGLALTWKKCRRLVNFDGVEFGYDEEGLRISKTDKDGAITRYIRQGSTLLAEERGDERILYYAGGIGFEYEHGGERQTYFYLRNCQGDVTALLDSSGIVAARYVYDAWGNHRVSDASGTIVYDSRLGVTAGFEHHIGNVNPLRYRGYYYDPETALYYTPARYYDPAIGRWINADDVSYLDPAHVNGLNLYSYCGNNPVMLWDGNGNFAISIFLFCLIGGAVLGGVTRGVNAYNDGARGWDLVGQIAIGVGAGALIGGAVGVVAGLGGAYLAGGISSVFGKFTTDLVAHSMYGTPIGNWEDYAVAFAFGGLTRGLFGKGLSWGGFGLDVAIRPLFNQLAKIGTGRQSEMNWSKYGYDVATRALTYAIPSPWRTFVRGITRGHWSVYGWGLPNSQNVTQFYYA